MASTRKKNLPVPKLENLRPKVEVDVEDHVKPEEPVISPKFMGFGRCDWKKGLFFFWGGGEKELCVTLTLNV